MMVKDDDDDGFSEDRDDIDEDEGSCQVMHHPTMSIVCLCLVCIQYPLK